jgi:hypothetical protein
MTQFVRFVDGDGMEIYVNPDHVVTFQQQGGLTHVTLSNRLPELGIWVSAPADEVCRRLVAPERVP